MRHLMLGLMLACAAMTVVLAGPLEDGIDALNRRDNATGLQILRPLADQGNAVAQYQIGLMYFHGAGVQQDYAEALKWIRKSADQNDAAAQYVLGGMYKNGNGASQDIGETVKWYRKAAAQGHAVSQTSLGLMYYTGIGVPQDLAAAVEWTRKAAEQGNADGQSNLGVMYAEGKGVPQDPVEAAKWYAKAAVQGQVMAQSNLAHMYVRGLGVPKDYVEAYIWWSVAAAGFTSNQSEERNVTLGNRDRVAKQLTREQVAAADRRVETLKVMVSVEDGRTEPKGQTPALRRQDFKEVLRRDPRFNNASSPSVMPNLDQRGSVVVANCALDVMADFIFGPTVDELDLPVFRERFKKFTALAKAGPMQKQATQAALKCILDSGVLLQ